MDYARMWEQLKQDIKQQAELSNEINIIKILNRIENIELADKQYWESLDKPF